MQPSLDRAVPGVPGTPRRGRAWKHRAGFDRGASVTGKWWKPRARLSFATSPPVLLSGNVGVGVQFTHCTEMIDGVVHNLLGFLVASKKVSRAQGSIVSSAAVDVMIPAVDTGAPFVQSGVQHHRSAVCLPKHRKHCIELYTISHHTITIRGERSCLGKYDAPLSSLAEFPLSFSVIQSCGCPVVLHAMAKRQQIECLTSCLKDSKPFSIDSENDLYLVSAFFPPPPCIPCPFPSSQPVWNREENTPECPNPPPQHYRLQGGDKGGKAASGAAAGVRRPGPSGTS